MRFWVASGQVHIAAGGLELHCAIADFQELEPGFIFSEQGFEYWTPAVHSVTIDGDQQPTDLPDRPLYVSRLETYLELIAEAEPEPEPETFE